MHHVYARRDQYTPRHARTQALRRRREVSRRQVAGALLAAALFTATATPSYASTQYVVQAGDSLWALARTHGVSVGDLAEANAITDPDLINVGTLLTIPGREASGADADVHVVARGETLWRIATRYGIGLGQLARQNSLTGPDPVIRPGQTLIIQPGVSDSGPADPAPPPPPSAVRVVRRGDTLWSIAKNNGVSLRDLLVANGLSGEAVIHVGQTVLVPGAVGLLPAELVADPVKVALVPVFDRWANEYGVPSDLLKALAWFESGWDNTRVSSAGAVGIGQILPITADFVSENLVGATLDPHDADQNIQLSARFMRYLMDKTGDERLAIASYYQGLTATRQHGIYRSSLYYVDGILTLRARFA
jgi:LysM repeat protein